MGLIKNNTKTMLFTKIDKIINLLIKELNNDQETKRYMTYLTTSPLSSRSTNYNNEIYYQRDLDSSMTTPQTIDVSKDKDGSKTLTIPQVLFPYPYRSDKVNQEYCTMFVSNYIYNADDVLNENIYIINILIPSYLLVLKPYGESRAHKLMVRIADLFDNVETDSKSAKELGNIKFKIIGDVKEEKIVNSIDITKVTIMLKTNTVGGRKDINGYNSKF